MPIENIEDTIEEHDWAVITVGSGSGNPQFSYTIGLAAMNHPELIIAGISPQISHRLFTDAYNRIKNENLCLVDGSTLTDLATMETRFVKVSDAGKKTMMVQAYNHYDSWNFEALQLVWPDVEGNFPWDDDFNEEFKAVQPII